MVDTELGGNELDGHLIEEHAAGDVDTQPICGDVLHLEDPPLVCAYCKQPGTVNTHRYIGNKKPVIKCKRCTILRLQRRGNLCTRMHVSIAPKFQVELLSGGDRDNRNIEKPTPLRYSRVYCCHKPQSGNTAEE